MPKPTIPELLAYTLQKLDAGKTDSVMIPLGALNSVVSLSPGETPGTYRAILCTDGVEMSSDTYTTAEVNETILPLLMKHERLVQIQGILLAHQAEKFLKAVAP